MNIQSAGDIIKNLNPQPDQNAKAGDPQELGKDAFLKLLTTQMQYQDPLNPLEGIEFTQQLAQFTSLEQLYNISDSFNSMNMAIQAQNNFRAMDLVGKHVKAATNEISLKGGDLKAGGVFSLDSDAASVMVNISNQDGRLVRTLDLGPLAAGEHELEWDGKDAKGNNLEDGAYSFEVLAVNPQGEEIGVKSHVEGQVSGVTFDEGGVPLLSLDGVQVTLLDVLEITAPKDVAGDDGSNPDEDGGDDENTSLRLFGAKIF
jgi:flagellar basal-body rod modification protein FlgD